MACFLNNSHSPKSTLFPYTTLFRSANRLTEMTWSTWNHGATYVDSRRAMLLSSSDIQMKNCRRSSMAFEMTPEDRKSTRLNSSHSQISYAVFCLKKKTLVDITSFKTLTVGSVLWLAF